VPLADIADDVAATQVPIIGLAEDWFRRPRGRVSLVDRGILAAVNDEVLGTGSEPKIGIKGGSRRLLVEFSLAERGYYNC
ncbi:hypothetical protein Tco_0288497, partial [Tanacetum coccineum]